jgi:glutathione synthase/RimK-type ligase-like ATP-grasp enzyme
MQSDCGQSVITAYRWDPNAGIWAADSAPLPDLIYDRAFSSTAGQYREHREAVRRMLAVKPIAFMGRGLPGKLTVLAALAQHEELRPHVPVTLPYLGVRQLLQQLREHGAVVLKPAAGTHGKSVIRIAPHGPNGWHIGGRSRSNRSFTLDIGDLQTLSRWLNRFTAGRTYVLQPYLELTTPDDVPFDVRALAQKDGRGQWNVTGLAVRAGTPGGLTSNLHGGGKAESVSLFLASYVDEAARVRIERKLRTLASVVPKLLERHFGRLAELGIDLGVDRSGNVWIIEVNSKPGRAAFLSGKADDADAGTLSVSRPVSYARYLLTAGHFVSTGKTMHLFRSPRPTGR